MEYSKSMNVKITMKLSSKAVIIAIFYNLIIIIILLLTYSNLSIYDIVTKPNPGIHFKVSIPSIPPVLSDIDIKSMSILAHKNFISMITLFLLDVFISSFFQPLYLAYFIIDSFRNEITLGEQPSKLVVNKFKDFLAYNFLFLALTLATALVTLILPILGAILIIILLIVLFTWIYVPVILLLEPVNVLEAITKSIKLVTNNFDEFFKILIVSSITISIVETIISATPLEVALIFGLIVWLPIGTMLVSMIIDAYIIIMSRNNVYEHS